MPPPPSCFAPVAPEKPKQDSAAREPKSMPSSKYKANGRQGGEKGGERQRDRKRELRRERGEQEAGRSGRALLIYLSQTPLPCIK